jgi:endonuclease
MQSFGKATKRFMLEFDRKRIKRGQVFENEAVEWFVNRYGSPPPPPPPAVVTTHIQQLVINLEQMVTNMAEHIRRPPKPTPVPPGPDAKPGRDYFVEIGPGKFKIWNQEAGSHHHHHQDRDIDDIEMVDADLIAQELAFKRELCRRLLRDLEQLEPGLKPFHHGLFHGIDYPVDGTSIDILATDAAGRFVVVEMLLARGYARAIGRLLRFMGWVQLNLAEAKPVRGIIIAADITEDLRLAASRFPDVRLVEYEIGLKLKPVAPI